MSGKYLFIGVGVVVILAILVLASPDVATAFMAVVVATLISLTVFHRFTDKNDKDFITNPYKDVTNFITYDESLKKYQLKFDKYANLTMDEGTSVTIPKQYIECYVK